MTSSITSHYSLFNLNKKLGRELTEEIEKSLTFRENLLISRITSNNPNATVCETKPVGGISIDILKGGPNSDKFFVYVTSQFCVDDKNGGSTITSCISSDFHTLDEKREEFLQFDRMYTDKKTLYLGFGNDYYHLKIATLETERRDHLSYKIAHDLIGEGANFLLMRYLALIQFKGEIEMSALHMSGDICRNVYISDGPEMGNVNNRTMSVIKIKRIIIERCGIVYKSVTSLTLKGQIIKNDWDDCIYVMHINPLINVKDDGVDYETRIPLKENWVEDIQLFSKYLDYKTQTFSSCSTYIADQPELKKLIADYVQNLLMKQPKEILDYTVDFFIQYNPLSLPYNNYYHDEDEVNESVNSGF